MRDFIPALSVKKVDPLARYKGDNWRIFSGPLEIFKKILLSINIYLKDFVALKNFFPRPRSSYLLYASLSTTSSWFDFEIRLNLA